MLHGADPMTLVMFSGCQCPNISHPVKWIEMGEMITRRAGYSLAYQQLIMTMLHAFDECSS